MIVFQTKNYAQNYQITLISSGIIQVIENWHQNVQHITTFENKVEKLLQKEQTLCDFLVGLTGFR